MTIHEFHSRLQDGQAHDAYDRISQSDACAALEATEEQNLNLGWHFWSHSEES